MMERFVARFGTGAAGVATRLRHARVFGVVIAGRAIRRLCLSSDECQAGRAGPECT
jgi:hypothetical protein